MTWDAYNRRKSALREVLTIVDRRRDLTTEELLDRVDPRREAFAHTDDLILELQMLWFQRLSGELDRPGADTAETPESSAIDCWVRSAAALPGARSVLDGHLDDPVLAKGVKNERVMMAAASGTPMHHPAAAEHGEQIIGLARERASYPIVDDPVPTDGEPARTGGFVSRLKSALAA